ncbi:hypothetical protein COCOBI_09-0090 [Coccomyxa sp. Obi]|nr:hypothetical protein COCOBI_09-0090 [Coccomyxa sp. Obi]
MPEQQVIWYVMSDCEGLPFRAAEAFGDKVLLPSPAARVDHIDHATSNRTHDELVLRSTFAEHHLFSLTDFQVITDSSSYGKMAALASLRSRSIFVVKTLFKVDGKPHGCFRSNYDSFEYLANA